MGLLRLREAAVAVCLPHIEAALLMELTFSLSASVDSAGFAAAGIALRSCQGAAEEVVFATGLAELVGVWRIELDGLRGVEKGFPWETVFMLDGLSDGADSFSATEVSITDFVGVELLRCSSSTGCF